MRLAIVIPCFNEAACLNVMTRMLLRYMGPADFILFVDDGSTDASSGYLRQLQIIHPQVHVERLLANRGHQFALLRGLLLATGKCDAAITMDADGQHDPRAIPDFIAKFREGADIVYGVRRRNSSLASRLFYWLMGDSLIPNHGDYRLISAKVLDTLTEDSEPFLRGLFSHLPARFKTAIVEYDEQPRIAGKSTYTLRKRIALFGDALKWRFGLWKRSA